MNACAPTKVLSPISAPSSITAQAWTHTPAPSRAPGAITAPGAIPGALAGVGGEKWATSVVNASDGLSTSIRASGGSEAATRSVSKAAAGNPGGTSTTDARVRRNAGRYFGLPKNEASPPVASARVATPVIMVSWSD